MSRYQEYRMKEILDYLHETRRFVSASQVAEALGISWNTAKSDLDTLSDQGLVQKSGVSRPIYRFKFR